MLVVKQPECAIVYRPMDIIIQKHREQFGHSHDEYQCVVAE